MTKSYVYDAFGNEKNPADADANPFRYCGEYFDKETGSIYLRARYYVPGLGRFTTQDPIRDGLNWYTYCGNNPIAFIDPFGLERLVVSGGRYGTDDDYEFEFIDSALKEIESYSGKESKTLMIADAGLTDADKAKIQKRANFYGYNVRYFTDVADLNDYINNGSDNNRADDPISKFRVFSHGYAGSVEFGHGVSSGEAKERLSWTIAKITDTTNGLKSSAFKKTDSIFYSCNAGTLTNGTSFAQEWSNITGGKTKAAIGSTWYGDINSFVLWSADTWLTHKSLRDMAGGYAVPYPAFNRPGLGDGAKWKTFRPQ